ncbi:jg23225 [Pararge aegeria aegeria]|uniref:Jg23225 protein n=1 Tax=Pararge aegeria aegeria TaxID=348720 RepID=A0A8S4RGQ2_9NEOP|nr:jg23225 [Pararge aegeria aegeria]
MEGLRQKGWTLLTIMLILIASWRCNTVATLTGQGDNQVIYLRIPSRKTLEDLRMTKTEYITWFQTVLRDLCTGAGIIMKLEETWVSGILLEYGREFFVKGAQLERYPVEYITSLLSTSRVMGGFPVTLFANFCTRAVQDPLTSQLCLIKTFMASPRHRPHILRVATTLMKHTDPKMLIQDPLSLPINMPRQPENYIKDMITVGVPSLIKNKELLPLFGPEVGIRREELLTGLMRQPVLLPSFSLIPPNPPCWRETRCKSKG